MSSVKGKKLLILGGASQHCKVVEAAKRLGVETYVADYLPSAPAKDMADHSYQINVTETERLAELCRAERIDGVISGWLDFCQVPYQRLCEAAGLPCYGTREQFDILTDKLKFKNLCLDYGVGTIPFASGTTEDILEFASRVGYPLQIKPVDSRGSRGQSICNQASELVAAIDWAMDNSRSKMIIAEKRIIGFEDISVTYYFQDGRPIIERLSSRILGNEEDGLDGLAVGSISPAQCADFYVNSVHPRVLKMLEAIGVTEGPVFFQGFKVDDDILFYDPGRRFPGGDYERSFYSIWGIDLAEEMVKYALTGSSEGTLSTVPNDAFKLKSNMQIIYDVTLAPGTIHAVNGIESIRNLSNVDSINLRYKSGDIVADDCDVCRRFAEINYTSSTLDEAAAISRLIRERISVIDGSGGSMVISPFSEEINNYRERLRGQIG